MSTPSVWSYCGRDWIRATRAAGAVEPLTSPPLDAETIGSKLAQATAAAIVYLNLHGFKGQAHYYGQANGFAGPTALTASLVAEHDWSDCVIFCEVCYSAADGGDPIARAFLANGARAVIGSTTEAYGRIRPTLIDGEADRLMWLFRRAYKGDPTRALEIAKRWLRFISWPLDSDDRKTLESFICLEAKWKRKS